MDEVVFQRFVDGDDAAFTFIYNKYVDLLLQYGRSLGFEKEVLIAAIHLNQRYLGGGGGGGYYLFRSLKNNLLDMLKVSVDTCSIDDYQYKFTIKWNILNELIAEEDKKEIEGKLNKLLSSLTCRKREIIYKTINQ